MNNNKKLTFEVNTSEESNRLDQILTSKLLDQQLIYSRSAVQKFIKSKQVKVNSHLCTSPSQKLIAKDNIEIEIKNNTNNSSTIEAKKIDFEIMFEDQYLAVINKPYNLTTHPGAGNYDNTLANGLLYKFQNELSSISGISRPGIVHRLDKDTSGIMIIAKNDQSHHLISKQIQEKQIIRKYLAFIYGVLNPKSGKIDKNITRNRVNRLKMATTNSKTNSRNAVTLYNTIKTFNDDFASLIECELKTGRTHQIRVHLESLKHSIIGDQTYNSCQKQIFNNQTDEYRYIKNFSRQALHSYYIRFTHPFTGSHHEFSCEPPADIQKLQSSLNSL